MLDRSQVYRLVYAGFRKQSHVLWHLEPFSGQLPVKVFKTLNDRQSYILSKFDKSKNSAYLNYQMSIAKIKSSNSEMLFRTQV